MTIDSNRIYVTANVIYYILMFKVILEECCVATLILEEKEAKTFIKKIIKISRNA